MLYSRAIFLQKVSYLVIFLEAGSFSGNRYQLQMGKVDDDSSHLTLTKLVIEWSGLHAWRVG